MRMHTPPHPGEILRELCLSPLGVTVTQAAVNLRTAGSWPVHDVEAALVYACSSRQVTDTWVAGRRVFAEGSLRYIDEESALERGEAWRARIDAAHGGGSD